MGFTTNAQWEQILHLVMGYYRRGWAFTEREVQRSLNNLLVDMPASPSDDVLALRGLSIDIFARQRHDPILTPPDQRLYSHGSRTYEYTKNRRSYLARASMVTLAVNWDLTDNVMMEHKLLSSLWAYHWQTYDVHLEFPRIMM
ncbi:hypothetical protein CJF32_00001244 [Rutstroemia sp. NJR-2017a WRK4]|nr:hypothetical protein CJF32_00001244 [Rutstroemia sp. NJR-2017a WRK4]